MRRIASGDAQALRELYDLQAPRLLGLLTALLRDPHEAEDVLQQVFLQVWREAGHYDPHRGAPYTWLVRIARSRALDALRRRAPARRAATRPALAAPVPGPESEAVERLDLQAALRGLHVTEQRCLELAYHGGYSQSQIAELLNMPLGSVKSAMRRALHKLRRRLGKGEQYVE